MKKHFSSSIIALLLIFSVHMVPQKSFAQAIEMGTDKYAHLGVSYAINTVFYTVNRKAFRLERTESILASVFVTTIAGLVKEYMDMIDAKRNNLDGGDLLFNGIGTALSVGTVLILDF